MIGGCAKVTQDCPPFMLIDGNPARAVGLNIVGLKRRNIPEKNIQILKDAFRILYREQLSRPNAIEKINRELERCPELEHLLNFISSTKRGIIKGGRE
jgi:UDP-N-acetylglucosamine acyltransferase